MVIESQLRQIIRYNMHDDELFATSIKTNALTILISLSNSYAAANNTLVLLHF